MSVNYKDFQFQFTSVKPPASDVVLSALKRQGVKYITVAPNFLHFGTGYPGEMDAPYENLINRTGLSCVAAVFEDWRQHMRKALSPAPGHSFTIVTSIDAPIFNQTVKLPNVHKYAEWLVQNSVKLTGLKNANEWENFHANLSYGCYEGLYVRDCFIDEFAPADLRRCLANPLGVYGRKHSAFIRKATAVENGTDVFAASQHEPWRMDFNIGAVKPVSDAALHLAAA